MWRKGKKDPLNDLLGWVQEKGFVMYYNSFLVLMSQLAFGQEGKISLHDFEIEVKSFPHTSQWELRTHLSSKNLPLHIRSCLRSGRRLPLESERSYLQKNEEGISLVQSIPSPKKYLQYKHYIESFFEILNLVTEDGLCCG